MSADLSVVVCTNRAPVHLGATLDAIDQQTIRDRLEVVVVDDGAPEPLTDVCRRHDVQLYRHAQNLGLAAARNTGWRAATAPIVAFTDDDCRPLPRWAEVLRDAYADPLVLAVGGQICPSATSGFLNSYYRFNNPLSPLEAELGDSPSSAHRVKLYLQRSLHGPTKSGRRPVFSLPGASMSLRRSALEQVAGFDPGIRFGGEDEDFFYRLRAAMDRGIFLFEPEAATDHDFAPSIRDALRRARSYGRGNARNFIKHPSWGPTVFPAPALTALLILAGARRPRLLALAALVPVVAFPRRCLEARRHRKPEIIAFAYLQLLEEAVSDIGFAVGYSKFRRDLRGLGA